MVSLLDFFEQVVVALLASVLATAIKRMLEA